MGTRPAASEAARGHSCPMPLGFRPAFRTQWAIRTPHPGPLPVEGRGRTTSGGLVVQWRAWLAQRSPSPLNGERAGVRGANGPLRSTPLAALTPSSQILVASDRNVRAPLNTDAPVHRP